MQIFAYYYFSSSSRAHILPSIERSGGRRWKLQGGRCQNASGWKDPISVCCDTSCHVNELVFGYSNACWDAFWSACCVWKVSQIVWGHSPAVQVLIIMNIMVILQDLSHDPNGSMV